MTRRTRYGNVSGSTHRAKHSVSCWNHRFGHIGLYLGRHIQVIIMKKTDIPVMKDNNICIEGGILMKEELAKVLFSKNRKQKPAVDAFCFGRKMWLCCNAIVNGNSSMPRNRETNTPCGNWSLPATSARQSALRILRGDISDLCYGNVAWMRSSLFAGCAIRMLRCSCNKKSIPKSCRSAWGIRPSRSPWTPTHMFFPICNGRRWTRWKGFLSDKARTIAGCSRGIGQYRPVPRGLFFILSLGRCGKG